MANKLKEKPEAPKEKASKQPKTGVFKAISDTVKGKVLTGVFDEERAPFFFFLMFMTMVYIANGYYAEDTVRKINKMENELKELRSEYIYTKSDLMFRSKQSEVAKSVADLGIKESTVPPKKIVVSD